MALAMSGLLHAVFAAAILATATGTAPRGSSDPFGDGETVEVLLSGREGAPVSQSAAAAQPSPSDLEILARRVRDNADLIAPSPDPARRSGDLASLFDAAGRLPAPGARGQGPDAAGEREESGQDLRSARATRPGENTTDVSSGDLWGQVEPCWRRIGGRSTVPVTLEVRLDGKGALAAPPRILRPAGPPPTEERLLAEARALEAIRACLPYRSAGPLRLAPVYRLAFAGR